MFENENYLKWNEIRNLVDAVEPDVLKTFKGNSSAGVRTRKALRILKAKVQDLVKLTFEVNKTKKEET